MKIKAFIVGYESGSYSEYRENVLFVTTDENKADIWITDFPERKRKLIAMASYCLAMANESGDRSRLYIAQRRLYKLRQFNQAFKKQTILL